MELRKCQLAMLSVVSARYSAYFYTTYTLVANCGVRHHSTEYFLCLAKSLEYAGIVKTEIAQRLSVVLSLLAAYFFSKSSLILLNY